MIKWCSMEFINIVITFQGTFNLTITEFEMCKGPKQKDCTIPKASINNSSSLDFDLIVLQNVTPTKVRYQKCYSVTSSLHPSNSFVLKLLRNLSSKDYGQNTNGVFEKNSR